MNLILIYENPFECLPKSTLQSSWIDRKDELFEGRKLD